MSKKSRKRNKKILGILAAGLGAAALMKRRKLANATDTVNPVGGVDQMAADAAPKGNWITKKDVLPKTKVDTDSRFDTRFSKPQDEIISKGVRARNLAANAAANYQRKQTFDAKPRFGALSNVRVNQPGSAIIRPYKKGGRVTGIAKRGFGRALRKGKK